VSLADVTTETASILKLVPNIGRVNEYRRAVQSEADFRALFVADGRVLAWDVTRESTISEARTVGATYERHLVVVRGYMGVKDADATEPTFQALIELIRATMRGKRNLNSKVLDTTPMQARLVGAATIQGVLCHYCELTFEAIEFPLSTN